MNYTEAGAPIVFSIRAAGYISDFVLATVNNGREPEEPDDVCYHLLLVTVVCFVGSLWHCEIADDCPRSIESDEPSKSWRHSHRNRFGRT